MNYVEFNNGITRSENEEYVCRICLESDDLENLIYPCRCSGNSKYVHRRCLNEWRIINTNNRNYTNCDICDYQFRVSNTNRSHSICYRIFNYLSLDPLAYLLITSITAYILSMISYIVDSEHLVISAVFGNISNMDNQTIRNYYFILILIMIIVIEILVIFMYFLFIKNKAIYCTIYRERLPAYMYSMLLCGFIYILFGLFYFVISLEILSLLICKNHIDSIKKLYEEDNISTILNYNGENDNEL